MEDVLHRCIKSLYPVSCMDYEIILVDDGSTDHSGQIIDEYANEDEHIKVIHKQNGGLSSARNAGMIVANGTYISFVDPDDYVEQGYVDKFYKQCLLGGDIIVGGVKEEILKNGEQIDFRYNDMNFNSISSVCAQTYIQQSDFLKSCFMHAKFLRKDIIDKHNLRFKGISPTEDTIFLFEYIIHATNITFLSYQGYHYIIYPRQSLSQKLPRYDVSLKISDYLYERYQTLFNKFANINSEYKNGLISEYGLGQRIVALIDLYSNKRLIYKERLHLLKREREEYKKWTKDFKFRANHKKQGIIFSLIANPVFPLPLVDMAIRWFYFIKKLHDTQINSLFMVFW